MTRYTITACDAEFTSSHRRDTYDVWTIAVCDPNLPDGENVVRNIHFTDRAEREEAEREGFEWLNTDFVSAPGERLKDGDSWFYAEGCTVDFHIDYCFEI